MQTIISDKIINSLCWTLIHSLWQGFILAIIVTLFIQFSKNARPQNKYNVLLVIFFAQIIFSFTTFFILLANQQNSVIISADHIRPGNILSMVPGVGSSPDNYTSNGFFSKMATSFNQNAYLIVASWLFIIMLLGIKMLTGILYLKKLRTVKTFQPSSYWKKRIEEMAKSMKLKRPVKMLESELVKSPMIIGCLKPLILLPIGLINDYNLSQNQIEAILYHELAHIRRHDYVINIIQTLAEMLLFFNPFIWWISSLLREEREYCCDAVVVNNFSDKRTLVEALVSFQELKPVRPAYALGFLGGRKYKLLHRVKQIFQNRNNSISLRTKFVLASCLIVFFFGIMNIYSKGKKVIINDKITLNNKTMKLKDTIPSGTKNFGARLKEINEKYLPLEQEVQGKINKHENDLKQLENEKIGKTGKELHDIEIKEMNLVNEINMLAKNVYNKKANEIETLIQENDSWLSAKESADAAQAKNTAGQNLVNSEYKLRVNEAQLRYNESVVRKNEDKMRESEDKMRENEGGGRVKEKKMREQEQIALNKEMQELGNEKVEAARTMQMLHELQLQGLIKSTQGVSFVLNANKFILNNKEQPVEIRNSFFKKYGYPQKTTFYNFSE